jgi:hypothetical protein
MKVNAICPSCRTTIIPGHDEEEDEAGAGAYARVVEDGSALQPTGRFIGITGAPSANQEAGLSSTSSNSSSMLLPSRGAGYSTLSAPTPVGTAVGRAGRPQYSPINMVDVDADAQADALEAAEQEMNSSLSSNENSSDKSTGSIL